MLGATSIVKNNYKEKYVYSGYGIAFEGKGEWSFGNDSAKKVIKFRVDNRLSSHLKIDFLILGKGPTFGVKGCFGASEKKKLILVLVRQKQNFV